MRRIAFAIESSPTAVYLHFADKQALLTALCDETFERLVHRLERQRKKSVGHMTFLRDGLVSYVQFGLDHPHHYTVTFIMGAHGGGPYEYEGSSGARAFGMLREAVQACIDAGQVPAGDADATAQALWAAAHGVTALLIRHPHFPFVARRRLVAHTIDTMLAGLAA